MIFFIFISTPVDNGITLKLRFKKRETVFNHLKFGSNFHNFFHSKNTYTVTMAKPHKTMKSYTFNPQTSIYISDSEDEEEGKLVIDEATIAHDQRSSFAPPIKQSLREFQTYHASGDPALHPAGNLPHLVPIRSQISVRLRSALTQPKYNTNFEGGLQLPMPHIPSIPTSSPQEVSKPSRPYTNFNIATLLSTPFKPAEKPVEPEAVKPQPNTTSDTIYYALTPDYKCTICNPLNKMGPKPGYHISKPNMPPNGFEHPGNLIYSYPSMNKKPHEFPTYCLMPTTPTASYKAAQNLNTTIKRVRPYEVRPAMQKTNLIPSPSIHPSNISEKDSILRSIIQSTNDFYKVILSIQILASKFLPQPEPKQTPNNRNNMLVCNMVDLSKSVHYLMSYGDMRINLIRIRNNYICIHLLKDYDNSIIDFRTLSKAETLVIRDTVRFGPKWNVFCILLQNNALDRESTLLFNHIFHKY